MSTPTPTNDCEMTQRAKKRKKDSDTLEAKAIYNKYIAELQREPDDIAIFAGSVAADLRNMRHNGASNVFIEHTKLKIRKILLEDFAATVTMLSSSPQAVDVPETIAMFSNPPLAVAVKH